MSIASALEAMATVWKNWIVLVKRIRNVISSINLLRVGSLYTAARIMRLPHWLSEHQYSTTTTIVSWGGSTYA